MTHLKTAPLPTRPHASQTPGDGDAPHLPLLRRLTIAQKLTTLGLLLGLPLAGLSVLVGAQDVQQYRAASQQLQIAGHYGTLERLQLQLREIRGSAPQQVSAQQLSGSNVRVNAICPGLTETGMTKPTFDYAREAGKLDRVGRLNPLRRGAQPEELARAALFLASDEASYVNGQALAVDGGLSSSHPVTKQEYGKTAV